MGLPCPPPGDLLDPEIKPRSPALQADSLLSGRLEGSPVDSSKTQPLSQSFLENSCGPDAPPEHLTVHPETRDTVVPPPALRGSLPASFSPAWTCTSQMKREHHSPRLCVPLGPQLQQDVILNVPKGTILTKEGHLTKPSKR